MDDVTFARYDTADYLKTETDIAAYLEAITRAFGLNILIQPMQISSACYLAFNIVFCPRRYNPIILIKQ
jgi:hypothetical protein